MQEHTPCQNRRIAKPSAAIPLCTCLAGRCKPRSTVLVLACPVESPGPKCSGGVGVEPIATKFDWVKWGCVSGGRASSSSGLGGRSRLGSARSCPGAAPPTRGEGTSPLFRCAAEPPPLLWVMELSLTPLAGGAVFSLASLGWCCLPSPPVRGAGGSRCEDYHAPENKFERFGFFLELISRFEFDFRRPGFFLVRLELCVFKVQSHVMRLYMCMCCGLFAPT